MNHLSVLFENENRLPEQISIYRNNTLLCKCALIYTFVCILFMGITLLKLYI